MCMLATIDKNGLVEICWDADFIESVIANMLDKLAIITRYGRSTGGHRRTHNHHENRINFSNK